MKYRYFSFIPVVLIFSLSTSIAQIEERYTAEEVKKQDQYMAVQVDILMERYDLAVKKLKKLYKDDLGNALYAFDLAKAYDKLEDYANAEKYSAIAIRGEPDNVYMLQYYAELMTRLERYDVAAQSFGQLIKLDPLDLSHIENQAKAMINLGKTDEAIKVMEAWEAEHYVMESLVRLKFDIYTQQGEKNKAEKELAKLVEFDPVNIRYLNNLAAFYLKEGKEGKAREIYEKVLLLDPNDQKANAAIFKLASEDQKDGPYLRSLLPLIERKDIDPEVKVLELIPYVNQLAEKPEVELQSSLLKLSETLSLIHPDHAKSLAIRADVLNLVGQSSAAIAAYEKTLKIDKKVYDVWQQLLWLLAREKRYEALGEWAYLAMDYFPNKWDNFYYYGLAQNELGKTEEAMGFLQEGLMVAANNPVGRSSILTEMGRASIVQNKLDIAEGYIEQALGISSGKNPYALEIKGDILSARGLTDEAQKYWKKAKALGSTRTSLEKKLNQ